jgi:hypothetical protein
MNETPTLSWEEANRGCLMAALSEVRTRLANFLAHTGDRSAADQNTPSARPTPQLVTSAMHPPAALETLCGAFGLSTFEREILLMCAGVELDSQFADLCQAAAKDLPYSFPTFSLAMAAFENAHWSALLPTRPLRYWHLVEVGVGNALTTSPLRIDERVLHYLAGTSSMDERLRSLTKPMDTAGGLSLSQYAVAEQIANRWPRPNGQSPWPAVQLCGGDLGVKRGVAAAACAILGLNLCVLRASALPRGADELELVIRLWEREAQLYPLALLLEFDEMEPSETSPEATANRFLETFRPPLLVSVRERRKVVERLVLSFDVPRPTSAEQGKIWKEALGATASALNGNVDALISQFSLGPGSIHAVVAQALPTNHAEPSVSPRASGTGPETQAQSSGPDLAATLWEACRFQSRPALEGMAQRIASTAGWDDLVLPEKQKQLLGQIATQVRQRAKVYQTWGFASKDSRGLGISALFAGPSGTGKTMAGEVLANQLRLDLYRIDLSQVVSKYIGETEKNLRRVFDAAEEGAAILLFDEADALFGKRSEVKDSHDRYANIEVSYLLQRMEAYRGLAILTTNRKDALDSAFLRRIRFVVEFPFPEAAQRAEIWRRVFPAQTPTEGLRFDRLARLNAAGGHIRNIALGAAFLAADAEEPVRMSHLLAAARTEFTKLERPLTDSETAGWS